MILVFHEDLNDNINFKQLQNLFFLTKDQNLKRDKKDLAIAVANSNVVVTFSDKDTIVGFARVTSDAIYRAVIWDLLVHPKYQNLGIENKLIKAILSHSLVSQVERVYFVKTCYKQSYHEQTVCQHNQSITMILDTTQKN